MMPAGTGTAVEEWMAFLTDPDGHPLAIMAQVPSRAPRAEP
jgi:hypothetical protein